MAWWAWSGRSDHCRDAKSVHAEDQAAGQCCTELAAACQVIGRDRFGARIASGVWACVLTISAGATAFSRQPVQMRSIWRAAPLPSLPAQTIAA